MSTASQVAISVDAPGKVNLYLAVGDVRPDGYHPLITLFAAVSLMETITVSEGQASGLSLSMDIVPGLPGRSADAGGAVRPCRCADG